MVGPLKVLAAVALLGLLTGCETGRRSPSGFRLPDTASAERGKVAFQSLGCNSCHEVTGYTLPRPANQIANAVVLGGETDAQITDGYLVTSIIYPTYRADRRWKGHAAVMPNFGEKMTVQQLSDMVEFLQTSYRVRTFTPAYYH